MWPVDFETRLTEWSHLRSSAQSLDTAALQSINDWWFRAPMINHHLHWDDAAQWPDPWDLLSENQWCDLARALGIVYTILMIDENMRHRVTLVSTCQDNLVLVDDGKYMLNWSPGELLNIHSVPHPILRTLTGEQLYQRIGQ